MHFFHVSAWISGNALVRIEAKHPIELQMFARGLQQKPAMSALGNPARRCVRFPRPICHNQGDFWVPAKNLQRSIGTRVIIGDYRIYVLADIVKCIPENECFIANAGDSDQKMPVIQEASIASNDLFTVAELPTIRARHDRHLVTIRTASMMVGGRSNRKG